MLSREFIPEKDRKDCYRIWRDIGWLEKGKEEVMDISIEGCRARVCDLNGEAEALGLSCRGSLKYLGDDIPLSVIAAITTGYAGRRRGLASKLTAELVALDAAEGAALSALGIFDQGYYDKFGFGTGPYETSISFDPATLKINRKTPTPVRLTIDDFKQIHESRINRMPHHGAAVIHHPAFTKTGMKWDEKSFGLGFKDENGELTHHFWAGRSEDEHGPCFIEWMAYRNYSQFLDLMSLIKNLGDQFHLVRMTEPASIQLQDFIDQPFRNARKTRKSKFETANKGGAYWQMRICDLQVCLSKTHLRGGSVSFGLELSDPITDYLDTDVPWRGIAGDYRITLGPESKAEAGASNGLPVLKATVGAFTRMWLGVRPATGLAVTDKIDAPLELLQKLDEVLCLPSPRTGWEF